MSNTQDETKRTEPSDTVGPLARTIAKTLLGIGAAWARYGLTLGRASIEAYTRTLQSTSGMLGDLAEAFERSAESARSGTGTGTGTGTTDREHPVQPVATEPPPAQV